MSGIVNVYKLLSYVYAETKSRPVQLVYIPPDEVKGLSKLTYDIDARDCRKLWERYPKHRSLTEC